MTKEEKFAEIFEQAESGVFDTLYYVPEEGNVIGLSVKDIKKACKKQDVDFEEWLAYGQNRKKEEKK